MVNEGNFGGEKMTSTLMHCAKIPCRWSRRRQFHTHPPSIHLETISCEADWKLKNVQGRTDGASFMERVFQIFFLSVDAESTAPRPRPSMSDFGFGASYARIFEEECP
jgi:hypothetical protein